VGSQRKEIPKTLVSRGGREVGCPKCVHYVLQVLSGFLQIRHFSRSRTPWAGAGASSACACANVHFFPLLDARSSSTSLSASNRQCPCTDAYSPSSSESPGSRRKGGPNAGLGARGGGKVVRSLVDELVDPELKLPLPTVISRCAAAYSFLVLFQRRLLKINLKRLATIGICRTGRGVRQHGGCKADDVERSFLQSVTGVRL
jgi:hypothetical protein